MRLQKLTKDWSFFMYQFLKILLVVLCFSQLIFARGIPANNLHLQDSLAQNSNVTQEAFNRIIDKALSHYEPIVDKHWGYLQIRRYWSSSLVSATAQQDDDDWIVNMYGGLARRPEITEDSFTMVLCHELGHHLGGFPFVSLWAANEGQSDYFASQVCLKAFWKDDRQVNSSFEEKVDPYVKKKCDQAYVLEAEKHLCYRISVAGESLAHLLSVIEKSNKPSYDQPDPTIRDITYNLHPNAQCRLDTF